MLQRCARCRPCWSSGVGALPHVLHVDVVNLNYVMETTYIDDDRQVAGSAAMVARRGPAQ